MEGKKTILRQSVGMLLAFTILLGGVYTLAMTGLTQMLFPRQANGSLIYAGDGSRICGSEYLAQPFEAKNHLWGRVMNVSGDALRDKDGSPLLYGGPSNLSPAGEDFGKMMAENVAKIRAAHPEMKDAPIPVDLVTSSGSGLDPEISLAAAEYQVPRLARETGRSQAEVREIIGKCTSGRLLGIFGEPRVNVLKVNLMLDEQLSK
ncbi:potassium-transporting ATPase subunit C [Veillonellaceae bacterium WCA-693-APC-5D-A]|uniref:Potassium-transporting ATPase KdpC subunit n=1 Tax=Anaerovibrio slackiae TaxID=2652309 RepID=A0A6I2UF93_9FIRM|nr:potassium-transporting ATPase subunit C [Anaerovibrio slackiae]MSU07762.1 potassium-transporting ATPase subunit C [Anaerovibrio slackiae]